MTGPRATQGRVLRLFAPGAATSSARARPSRDRAADRPGRPSDAGHGPAGPRERGRARRAAGEAGRRDVLGSSAERRSGASSSSSAARSQAAGPAVVTLGSAGSNHAVATAVFARELGMTARAILHPHPDAEHVRKNLDRLASLDADARTATWLRLFATLVRGRLDSTGATRPLVDPTGGQQRARRPRRRGGRARGRGGRPGRPDHDARGRRGGRGLVRHGGRARDRVRARARAGAGGGGPCRAQAHRHPGRKILRLARGGLRILRRAGMVPQDEVVLGAVDVVHAEAGGGYAKPTPAGDRAAARATTAGVAAETTYTGKAWAHLFSGALHGAPGALLEHFRGPSVLRVCGLSPSFPDNKLTNVRFFGIRNVNNRKVTLCLREQELPLPDDPRAAGQETREGRRPCNVS